MQCYEEIILPNRAFNCLCILQFNLLESLKNIKHKWAYVSGAIIVLLIILLEAKERNDFDIFFAASKDLLQRKNIYAISYNDFYHYYYDVLFALLLVPFTFLPLYFVKILWLCANVFFVVRLWKILLQYLPIKDFNDKTIFVFNGLVFLFMLRFLRDNFHLAQLTIFILYLILEGLHLIQIHRKFSGALLIAFGINVKLLPLLMLPYLMYRNEWKAALYVVFCSIALLCIPILFVGLDFNKMLLLARWQLLNPNNANHILDTTERSFHSLTTLLSTLLVKDCGDVYALPIRRNIANISIEKLSMVINVVRFSFALFAIYFLQTFPFKNTDSNIQKLYELSYLCLATPLIFPHQQPYAFLFIFPAVVYLLFYIIQVYFNPENQKLIPNFKIKKIVLLILLCLVYFLTNSHFILGVFNNYYNHFKTLTYGILLLVIILAVCSPKQLLDVEEKKL